MKNYYLPLLIALLGSLNPILGQTKDPIYITRVSHIIFDGKVDDPEWEAIEPFPLVQYEPMAGAAPTHPTEVRLAYDDKYIYASLRAYEIHEGEIRATSLYRDQIAGSDHTEIMLDTYNDNQSGYIFTTTPTGIRNDAEVFNDATVSSVLQGGAFNRDFNTFWDAATTVTEEGWFAEIRIPFSSLRFQEVNGEVTMGLTMQRKIAHKNERLVFPAIPPITNWAFLRPSLAQKIVFTGIRPSKTLYVTPYLLGGQTKSNTLNEAGTAYASNTASQTEVGGDVKFSITNNLTADFTVNTDFAQAEADDQLVNLTRFSLFFPEKRQFFQERSAVFDFRTGGISRLFFSRRIGLTDDGQQVPIYGGVRLIGRSSDWDFGLLDMQTKALDALPTENFGVLRIRKRVFNPNSFVGGMFTSRLDANGNSNLAYGLDGLFRVSGDDYLTLQWAQTFDSQISSTETSGVENGRLALEFSRRRRKGIGFTFGTIYSGEDYNPGVGFVDRSNFKFGTALISQTWLNKEGPFIFHTLQPFANAYLTNGTNDVTSSEYGTEWLFTRRNQDNGGIKLRQAYENLPTNFSLAQGASIPAGAYNFSRINLRYTQAIDRLMRAGIEVETGSFYDGHLSSVSLSPSWYVSRYFQVNLQYIYNKGAFSDRNQDLNFHIARLRIGTALDRKLSLNGLFQYNGAQDLFSLNARLRYNFREGQDLWIVFNSGYNTERDRLIPVLPQVDSRSLLLKYIHTFIF
ncbi:carbohydrate binding family 9 domain-containing protein [Robiginitalea sp.]|nr:carbohydrate binding family 9 domain-containing protein [Robiginitalea sp.]